ncbi:MAG: tRNA threonylcarbamoyladenosine biosynthesis protein TsaE [Candidatus Omnitrophota bacterium]|jgi:tRNA threonylcarbamoyladenosine biosynthesis protein TsaE
MEKLKKFLNTKTTTSNPAETKQIGFDLAKLLKPGQVLLLEGELGTGKTTLVQGIAEGLGLSVAEKLVSPTYVYIKEYDTKPKLYHIDLYRIKNQDRELSAEINEIMQLNGLVIVEWPSRMPDIWPKDYLSIILNYKNENQRIINFMAQGDFGKDN